MSSFVPTPAQSRLYAMLTYKRPHESDSEVAFIARFLTPLGIKPDLFGNLWRRVRAKGGKPSPILWSCHTDTVHLSAGRQTCYKTPEGLLCIDAKESNCLGADDTAGVWLMSEMIRRQVPGLYVFHRGEERGGLGSHWIAKNTPERLAQSSFAIALDRAGTSDIITHQGYRTASDEFAEALAKILGGTYAADDSGTFTDTKSYTELIPECTNLSVGYDHQHTSGETQDEAFLWALLETLCSADFSGLPVVRKTTDPKRYPKWIGGSGSYGGIHPYGNSSSDYSVKPSNIYQHVFRYPQIAAQILAKLGLTLQDLEDYQKALTPAAKSQALALVKPQEPVQ